MQNYLINILVNFFYYISIPLVIRYVFLRRPIKSKLVAIGILVPIFIGFSILINIQRDEFLKTSSRELNIPYKPKPHMIGSPILYAAMALSYIILRRRSKESEAMIQNFTPIHSANDVMIEQVKLVDGKSEDFGCQCPSPDSSALAAIAAALHLSERGESEKTSGSEVAAVIAAALHLHLTGATEPYVSDRKSYETTIWCQYGREQIQSARFRVFNRPVSSDKILSIRQR